MREVSFVKRVCFNFVGSVTKRALVIGDADNDGRNELVCANLQGDLAIFKGKNRDKFAYASNLGMVTACSIGDIINSGKNHVTAINMEGWLFIFDVVATSNIADECTEPLNSLDAPSQQQHQQQQQQGPRLLSPMYEQRMPANCKEMLLADLDGDGQNELIIGLTDRVLRTYKWVKIGPEQGKFVGLYKWEFADQIGSVSLNPSRHENCQDIVVAQPGGTYARLECFDKKPMANSKSTSSSLDEQHSQSAARQDPSELVSASLKEKDNPSDDGDNVRTEYVNKLTPEYHQLALAQMRNHHVSTEVLGNIKDGRDSNSFSLIVIATLDGTLMLVNKDEILWSLQVDHQLFALAVLETGDVPPSPPSPPLAARRRTLPQSESTCTIVASPSSDLLASSPGVSGRSAELSQRQSQHFVACAWNGKTYIIDEERNYLRFKFDEAVSAFTAGNYHFDGQHHSSLVYATFNNQIILYYDVLLDSIRPDYLLAEILDNPERAQLQRDLHKLGALLFPSERDDRSQDGSQKWRLHRTLGEILYNLNDQEIQALSDALERRSQV